MVKVGTPQHDNPSSPPLLSVDVMAEIRDVLDLSNRATIKLAQILRRYIILLSSNFT